MIELLNNYRAAKGNSEQAAKELGRAFGMGFEREIRNTPEYQMKEFDELNGPARIATLNNFFPVGLIARQALGGFINQEVDKFYIGVNLHNPVLARIEGSRVVLDEAPFMEGFIEGYNESRRSIRK